MMKRLFALLLALCSLLTAALADTQTQLAWALETAELLYKTADDEGYIYAMTMDPSVTSLIAQWAEGSPADCEAVYRITLDMDDMADVVFKPYGGLENEMPLRNERIMLSLATMYTGQLGTEVLVAVSGTTTTMAYTGCSGFEIWLIDCSAGGDVIVTFCPYDTGAVVVTASFLGAEIEAENLMKLTTGSGIVSVEKIQ